MLSFYPALPVWLLVCLFLLAAAAVVFSLRAGAGHVLAPARKRMLVALRALSFLVLAAMLASPSLNRFEENKRKSNIAFLLDRSLSMGVLDAEGGKSRHQSAANFINGKNFGKLSSYPMSFYTFNDKADRVEDAGDLAKAKVSGGTNFAAAVSRLDKDLGLSEISAIIFITDGIDHSGFRGTSIQTPIFCVRIGTELAECRDLGIGSFKCPEKVRIGEEVEMKIPVAIHGFDAVREAGLKIFEDAFLKEERTLALDNPQLVETVRRSFETEGIHILRLQLDMLPGEATYLNNARELIFEVLKDDSETAVYFPVLSNSFRPIIRLLEQNQQKSTAFYKLSDGKYAIRGKDPDPGFAEGVHCLQRKSASVGTFILASHNRPVLTDEEEDVVEKYVGNGGSLILLGGNDSFGILPESSPLKRLSPFMHAENSFASGNYRVLVNEEEANSFTDRISEIVKRNGDDPDFVLKSINAVRQVKNNSKVLLWAESAGARLPLLAVQPYGKGIVIGVLSNSFNLWGAAGSRDANFNDFWRQLLNFAKTGNTSDTLKISVNRSEIAQDEGLEVNAFVDIQGAGHDANALKIIAEICEPGSDKILETVQMESRGAFYSCSFPPLKTGRYILKVTCMDRDKVLRQRFKLILSGDFMSEASNVKSELGKFLDFTSEKRVYRTSERDRLEKDIYEVLSRNKVQRETRLVYETPWFFLALLALLVAEWTLRRKFNVV